MKEIQQLKQKIQELEGTLKSTQRDMANQKTQLETIITGL